jgi:hypothetical protein
MTASPDIVDSREVMRCLEHFLVWDIVKDVKKIRQENLYTLAQLNLTLPYSLEIDHFITPLQWTWLQYFKKIGVVFRVGTFESTQKGWIDHFHDKDDTKEDHEAQAWLIKRLFRYYKENPRLPFGLSPLVSPKVCILFLFVYFSF